MSEDIKFIGITDLELLEQLQAIITELNRREPDFLSEFAEEYTVADMLDKTKYMAGQQAWHLRKRGIR